MRQGRRFATCVLGIIILWVCLLVLFRGQRLRCLTGQHQTLNEVQANPDLSIVAQILPATGCDIRYYVRPLGRVVYVDFTVDREEFLDWAAAREWRPLPIQSTRCLEASPLSPKMVCVDHGFFYEEKHARDTDTEVLSSELRVVFDQESSRCYYRFTD